MKNLKLFFLLILFYGCSNSKYSEEDYLARIYAKENWDHNGILFLTESADVESLKDDSLDFYLTKAEKELAMDSVGYVVDKNGDINDFTDDITFVPTDTLYYRKIIYKNYGKIFQNKTFKVYTIYNNGSGAGDRRHLFYLRSYTPSHKLIDSIQFAVWDDSKEQYFSGELTKDLVITRTNYKNDSVSLYRISKTGQFEMFKEEKRNNSM